MKPSKVLSCALLLFFVFTFKGYTKNRIMVLTDTGGGAHLSTADAIESALQEEYEIKKYTPFEALPGRNLYNSSLKASAFGTIWWIVRGQTLVERWLPGSRLLENLEMEIDDFRPDLIISVIPVANAKIYDIARKKQIPYLVQSTDIDSRHFFRSLGNPDKNLWVGVPFEDILPRSFSKHIPLSQFVVLGYALRPEFQKTDEELFPEMQALKEEFGIKDSEKVVSIMMGAQGSGALLQSYVKQIGNSSLVPGGHGDLHLVALCGKNEEVRQKIEQQSLPNPRIRIHAVSQQSAARIAALMRLSHVLISKPGGATVNEGLASNVYTLFDTASLRALYWERGNMEFSVSKGAGEPIVGGELIDQLNSALQKPRPIISTCPGRSFSKNIREFVKRLFDKN